MILYILSIFLSAFALFLVQPLIGKAILPWFGGTSAVWSAVMLFFQTILTGGYAYAYWLTDPRGEKRRLRIHFFVVGLSLLLLVFFAIQGDAPILPGGQWQKIDHRIPVAALRRHHVRRQADPPRRDRPDVQVMDARDTGCLDDGAPQIRQVQIPGCGFHQHIGCFA